MSDHSGGRDRTRPLKVVTMIDNLTAGGAELMARTIALGLDPARFERLVVVTRPGVWDAEHLLREGVRVVELARRHRGALWAWPGFVSLLRRERVDILHAHKHGSNVNAVVWGRLAGVPLIVAHEHTWSFEGQPLRRLLDRELVGRFADAVLAVSEEDRRRLVEVVGLDASKIWLTPIAAWSYELRGRQARTRDVRSELGIAPETLVVGTVAKLRAQKALEVLLEASVLLRAQVPELRVLIAGSGPEESRLAALAAELGLGETVTFLGGLSPGEVPDLLEQLDVAINCSDWEGTPGNVLEAMAAGVPVVATRVGGTPDLIEHGVHGLLVPPRDPVALAAAARELLSDPERRTRMGEQARRRHRESYSASTLVERMEEIYEALWADRRRGLGRRLGRADGPGPTEGPRAVR